MTHPLDELAGAAAFALLCRGDRVEILTGAPLDRLPGADRPDAGEVVAVLPYRLIAERGLPCVDDGTPLLAFAVGSRRELSRDAALRSLPADRPRIGGGRFDVSDAEYEDVVRRVITEDIG